MSNIGRHRPTLAKHFVVQAPFASWDAARGQTINCSNVYDVDLPELKRQYPGIEWTREEYNKQVINNKDQRELRVIRFRQDSVQQMLNQTSTWITYLVDVPILTFLFGRSNLR